MVASQFLGVVWDSTVSTQDIFQGQTPDHPMAFVPGLNDEPFADRAIVCIAKGRKYAPMLLNQALVDPRLSVIEDTTGISINGYRVCDRNASTLSADAYDAYSSTCQFIDTTLEAIQDSCDAMGYNVTRDALRIVHGVDSNTTMQIPRALPILVIPFWDNAVHQYYAIPGWDGMACVFRLNGAYQDPNEKFAALHGVPRANRAAKVSEWVGSPRGEWRNGWFEDAAGQRWNSHMLTSSNVSRYGIQRRMFDTQRNIELVCDSSDPQVACKPGMLFDRWDQHFTSVASFVKQESLFLSNGTRFGKFLFDAHVSVTTENKYSLDTFISNLSVFTILFRWLVSMAVATRSAYLGLAPWHTPGVGCLSSSRTLSMYPLLLLPRLKVALAALWTAGCEFRGQQVALANAWFAVYPGIIECMFFFYSLLNLVAKISYRRMSDALFGPTVLFFCGLQYFRLVMARHGWFGINEFIPTAIHSGEIHALTVFDMFSSDAALRINGNVAGLFYLKVGVLALNVVPLLMAEKMTQSSRFYRSCPPCEIEKAIALRASNVGGLGRSNVYGFDDTGTSMPAMEKAETPREQLPPASTATLVQSFHHPAQVWPFHDDDSDNNSKASLVLRRATQPGADLGAKPSARRPALAAYELNRLGYLVFGGRFLLTFDDWYIITSFAPLRAIEKLWNHRITVFDVTQKSDGFHVSRTSRLCRCDDAELRVVPWYDVTVCSFR